MGLILVYLHLQVIEEIEEKPMKNEQEGKRESKYEDL